MRHQSRILNYRRIGPHGNRSFGFHGRCCKKPENFNPQRKQGTFDVEPFGFATAFYFAC